MAEALSLLWWRLQDRKILRRIHTLIADIARNGNEGIGKPESLKHGFQGYWSRRVDDEHRLTYKAAGDGVLVAQGRSHYEG
ncbi:Txe/YoeB family addiction module toxin [Streptomyces sp. BK239]|uniref:Txe/YoeB family addiction module toxin n=1 Tax=Streptomyces sp. BK239 TaxID=2512155 RepID=UPI00102C20F5|nr:Txe/YoeB family addiction module toxin [Streptomyces sp. BK239]RZU21673.1 toxin YoeB [Streptomyces sp. BK239]